MLVITSRHHCWRFSSFCTIQALREELAIIGSQASACGQFKLPTMHGTCQDTVLDLAKACEIGLEMWTAALDAVAIAFPELVFRIFFGVVSFNILNTFRRETFEENVDIFVVGTLALSLKATGEKEVIDPALHVTNNAGFDQSGVHLEAILPSFASPWIYLALLEVDHHSLLATVDEQASIDTHTGKVSNLQEGFEPIAQ